MKFKSELILQRITRENLHIFDLKLIAFEFQYNKQRFDTLAFDIKTNSFVIIEYKNEQDSKVLNQCESYYNLLLENKNVYIDKYNEVFNTDFVKDDFDFDKTRVLIIGPEFKEEQLLAAKSPSYPFEIWKVNLNEKFCISYKNVVTDETKYLQVTKNDLELTEEELVQNRSDKILKLYDILKNRVMNEFRDVTQRILINAFS